MQSNIERNEPDVSTVSSAALDCSISPARRLFRHVISLAALGCAIMLNISINGQVAASTPPAPMIITAEARSDAGLGFSASSSILATHLTAPEEILADWPRIETAAAHPPAVPDCQTALATRVRNTVFHFEAHQTVLGPEYFGKLQVLADQVTACPGVTLCIRAAGETAELEIRRAEWILHVLGRRGYNLAQFKTETGNTKTSRVSETTIEAGTGNGRIEFALLR